MYSHRIRYLVGFTTLGTQHMREIQPHLDFSTTHAISKPLTDKTPNHLPTTISHTLLTIRFLKPRPSTRTPKLLRLAPAVIRHKQSTIILDKRLLQLILGVLIDVFLVVGHDGLGDGLADGVDLRCVPATRHTHADVDVRELV